MDSDSLEGEEAVFRELDSGLVSSGAVTDNGIVVPSLAGVFEVNLETTRL